MYNKRRYVNSYRPLNSSKEVRDELVDLALECIETELTDNYAINAGWDFNDFLVQLKSINTGYRLYIDAYTGFGTISVYTDFGVNETDAIDDICKGLVSEFIEKLRRELTEIISYTVPSNVEVSVYPPDNAEGRWNVELRTNGRKQYYTIALTDKFNDQLSEIVEDFTA